MISVSILKFTPLKLLMVSFVINEAVVVLQNVKWDKNTC